MNNLWAFYNPVRIHFGRGCRQFLVDELANKHCLVVTSSRGRRQMGIDPIIAALIQRQQSEWLDTVTPNPSINDLQTYIEWLTARNFDIIIGFGGGSAIDSAKTLAIALSADIKQANLPSILKQSKLSPAIKPIPLYAVPTTAGTGSEVTPFATIWDHNQKKKYSLTGPAMFAHTAIVDPELTDNLPQEHTLLSGLDAINQAAESIWNTNATPITMAYATKALQLGFESLPNFAIGKGSSADRTKMAECSLLAGLAISQTKTSLCHSISYPITAHFGVPHGLACAFTMPSVLRLNLAADDGRLQCLEKNLRVEDLQQAFDHLNERLRVSQRLKEYVPSIDNLLTLINEMYTPERADNNLAQVNDKDIVSILKIAWTM